MTTEAQPAEEALWVILRPLKDSSDAAPSGVPKGTIGALIAALGSPDPALRDDLAVSTLVRWIVMDRQLSDDVLHDLHARARSADGALYLLGERDTTSVFRRSFSLLLLALLHAADNATPYLQSQEWEGTVETLERVGMEELDLRATVPGMGWAHAIAHAADLADELARSQHCTSETGARILAALGGLIDRLDHPFLGEEDDRVSMALAALTANKHISIPDVRKVAGAADGNCMELPGARRTNWKAVARSLFFRLENVSDREEAEQLQGDLTAV